ncbi:MAG: leucine-rich repeat domain-containing protein [Treponema sp.]|nr:leucine-rich repeat domain-containing protein [Treponema sp.]
MKSVCKIVFAVLIAGVFILSGCKEKAEKKQPEIKVTKDNVVEIIKNLEKTSTIIVEGEIDSDVIMAMTEALKELYESKPSVRVDLDMIKATGVTKFPRGAFEECQNLRCFGVPEVLTSRIDYLSTCYNLEKIITGTNSIVYKVIDDILYYIKKSSDNQEEKYISLYPSGKKDTKVVIPSDVKGIAECAFYESNNIQTVIISEGCTVLGDLCFMGCENLKTVILPKTLESIRESAFSGCSSLKTIYFRGTEEEWNNIQPVSNWNKNCPEDLEIVFNYDGE